MNLVCLSLLWDGFQAQDGGMQVYHRNCGKEEHFSPSFVPVFYKVYFRALIFTFLLKVEFLPKEHSSVPICSMLGLANMENFWETRSKSVIGCSCTHTEKELYTYSIDTCSTMLIATLFTVVRKWKWPTLTNTSIMKICAIFICKENEIISFYRYINATRKDHTLWGNPYPERQILHALTHWRFLALHPKMWRYIL